MKPKSDKLEPTEYLIPKGRHISVREGDYVEKGDYIVEGNPSPHDILRIKGMEELAIYLVKEIQDVYRLQGVKINDKHIEVICRQMMQKLEITDGGETTLIAGEHVDAARNWKPPTRRRRTTATSPPKAAPSCWASPRRRLQTRSVFSAASFQETTRVLTDAAVNGKVDMLEGLKENVIVGRLIPAGTGGAIARLRHIATERDKAIQAEAGGAAAGRRSWKRRLRPPSKRLGTCAKESGPLRRRAALFLCAFASFAGDQYPTGELGGGAVSARAKVRSMKLPEPMSWDRAEARKGKFNGKFILGVMTTGIYCLPSCAARPPKPQNVRLFTTEAEAKAAGLRACKRCRPDLYYKGEDENVALFEGLAARVAAAPEDFRRCSALWPRRPVSA